MLPHKTQLQQKYKKSSSFRAQMQQVQTKYKQLLQRAIYSDLSSISPKFIVEAGKDQDNHKLFFIFGEQQPIKKKLIDKLYLYLINYLDERIGKQNDVFSIVYFNTCCESYNNYSIFRTIYRTFPLKYFLNLKRMIIVDPSFTVKAMEWFISGTINKVLHNLVAYVYKLKEFKEYGIYFTKHKLTLLPSYLNQDKEKQILRLSIRESMQIRVSKKLPQKSKKTKKLRLEDYEVTEIGVPIALYLMISYFMLRKEGLKEEGLFRKSVIKSEIDEAMEFIKQKYYDFLEQIINPHIVANLITRFIGDLQQPLIPVSIYQKLIHDNGRSTQIPYLKQCFSTLPRQNKVTLIYFLDFLIYQVIALKEFNKMTCYNLAVVLTPCILKSGKELAIEELMYSKKLVIIVECVLNNYESIFGDQREKKEVYRESVKMEKEKFFKESVEGCQKVEGEEEKESEEEDDMEGIFDKDEVTEEVFYKTEDKAGQKSNEQIKNNSEQKQPKSTKHQMQKQQKVQVYVFQQPEQQPVQEEQTIKTHSYFPVKVMPYPDNQE